MQLRSGIHVHLIYDEGRFVVYIDGQLRLHLANVWCLPDSALTPFCTRPPRGAGHAFGQVAIGGPGAADVVLGHVRVYSYALPEDDLGAEAVCTDFGDCAHFGVAGWQAPQPPLAVPQHPLVPPSLRFVSGALLKDADHAAIHLHVIF